MKQTFAPKTLAARSFRCVTLGGPVVLGPYRTADAQATSTGATIGQDHHTGATAGLANG